MANRPAESQITRSGYILEWIDVTDSACSGDERSKVSESPGKAKPSLSRATPRTVQVGPIVHRTSRSSPAFRTRLPGT